MPKKEYMLKVDERNRLTVKDVREPYYTQTNRGDEIVISFFAEESSRTRKIDARGRLLLKNTHGVRFFKGAHEKNKLRLKPQLIVDAQSAHPGDFESAVRFSFRKYRQTYEALAK